MGLQWIDTRKKKLTLDYNSRGSSEHLTKIMSQNFRSFIIIMHLQRGTP